MKREMRKGGRGWVWVVMGEFGSIKGDDRKAERGKEKKRTHTRTHTHSEKKKVKKRKR